MTLRKYVEVRKSICLKKLKQRILCKNRLKKNKKKKQEQNNFVVFRKSRKEKQKRFPVEVEDCSDD